MFASKALQPTLYAKLLYFEVVGDHNINLCRVLWYPPAKAAPTKPLPARVEEEGSYTPASHPESKEMGVTEKWQINSVILASTEEQGSLDSNTNLTGLFMWNTS